MALGDAQIERYSRQIIVPRMGGRAQERLLASHVAVVGTLDQVADLLAYLVGAGVGTIHLVAADEASRVDTITTRMSDLNPDVKVRANLTAADVDLTFAILSSQPALDALGTLPVSVLRGPGIIARLDAPARIAVLPAPPPCIRCADDDGELLAPFGKLAAEGEFVAMAATVEVIKFLAGYEPASEPSIIRFDGYASVARQATRSKDRGGRCDCDGK